MKNELVKLSFIGDIMIELPMLNATKKNNYDFSKMLEEVKPLFDASDYVVGNLETPVAGKIYGYTNEMYAFNTPITILPAIKEAGINMVTTANNHALDRGLKGLKSTIKNLKKYDIDFVGTYENRCTSSNVFVKKLNGVKVGFVSATYGTNTSFNKIKLSKKNEIHIDLLSPQVNVRITEKLKRLIKFELLRLVPVNFRNKLKKEKMIVDKNASIVVDDIDNKHYRVYDEKLESLKNKINKTKNECDILVLLLHIGGQFNEEPGSYTREIVEIFSKENVDAIVCNHPHIIQHLEMVNNIPVAYSLGNFSLSPSTPYLVEDNLPTYSMMLNIYLSSTEKNINKVTFSFLKTVEKNDYSIVKPVDNGDDAAVAFLYNRATKTKLKENMQEYVWSDFK